MFGRTIKINYRLDQLCVYLNMFITFIIFQHENVLLTKSGGLQRLNYLK